MNEKPGGKRGSSPTVSEGSLTELKVLSHGGATAPPPSSLIPPSSLNPLTSARMAGDDRRRQILQVAVSLFSKKGFRGTTTKEIALASGVSEAMVFRHFANKKDLYAAILDHKAASSGPLDQERMVAGAVERKDDRAVFEGLAFCALQNHEADQEFQRLLFYSALEGHELAEMFFENFVRRIYAFLGAYLQERQREGAIIKVDPAIIVRAFIGMIIHHSLINNLWDPQRRLLRISNENAAKHFAQILLSGICAQRNSNPTSNNGEDSSESQ